MMDTHDLKCLHYTPAEHAQRAERILEITQGRSNGTPTEFEPEGIGFLPPSAIPCARCSRQAGYAGEHAGIVAYICLNQHEHFVDYSRELGLR